MKVNIKFDGIYKEDMKWTGKGYNINGNLEYEIKDGNGKFKEFYEDGILEFEGEIVKGKRSGYGKCWHGDQITFEGFFLNGDKTGYGKFYHNGKLRYEGNCLNSLQHGRGRLLSNDGNIIFEGEFLYDNPIKKIMK